MHKIILRNKNDKLSSTLSSHPNSEIQQLHNFDRVIFFIHGFPDNNESFNKVIPRVARNLKNPARTLSLAPLLRGYEPSSIVDSDYDYKVSDIASDIRDWILQIVPNNEIPVHLVGHDWGAIVTFKTAQLYPDLITSAATLAIPYLANVRPWMYLWYAPKQLYYSTYFFTMQFASLYKSKFADLTQPGGYLDKLWAFWSPDWDFSEDIKSVRDTLSQPRVLDAATAYYRNLFRKSAIKELKWIVDFDKVPTLIAGGDQDGCMTKELYTLESQLLAEQPNACVTLLKGLGHFLQREDPETVAEVISAWIAKH